MKQVKDEQGRTIRELKQLRKLFIGTKRTEFNIERNKTLTKIIKTLQLKNLQLNGVKKLSKRHAGKKLPSLAQAYLKSKYHF